MKTAMPILALMLLTSCSGSKSIAPGSKILKAVGFTDSIIEPKKSFLGFSARASRVAVIDPVLFQETSSYQLSEAYDEATELVNFNNIAVFSQTKLSIFAGSSSLSEPLTGWEQWHKSSDVAALVFSSSANANVKLVRNKSPGVWQTESFAAPWVTSGGNLVSFLRADGLQLVMTGPVSGSYALFEAASATQDLAGPVVSCTAGLINSGKWTSAHYDSASNTIFMGNQNGDIAKLELDKSAGCQAVSSWTQASLSTHSIISISRFSGSEIIVTNTNGDVFVLANSNLAIQTQNSNSCGLVISPLPLSSTEMVYLCLKDGSVDNDLNITFTEAYLEVYSFASASVDYQHKVKVENIASIALDTVDKKFYILSKSATGHLIELDFLNKTEKAKDGLFLDGILNDF